MQYEQYVKFLGTIEKLKCNTRHSWNSNGRQESVAEHSWRLAVMVSRKGVKPISPSAINFSIFRRA